MTATTTNRYEIVTVHGEGRSLFHVVDTIAGQDGDVLRSFTRRNAAEQYVSLLTELFARRLDFATPEPAATLPTPARIPHPRREAVLLALAVCATAAENRDEELAHRDADAALLDYINDPEITAAFHKIFKFYS